MSLELFYLARLTGRTSMVPPLLTRTSSGLTEGAPSPLKDTLKPMPWLAERLESFRRIRRV
jgi:hypothetical protein